MRKRCVLFIFYIRYCLCRVDVPILGHSFVFHRCEIFRNKRIKKNSRLFVGWLSIPPYIIVLWYISSGYPLQKQIIRCIASNNTPIHVKTVVWSLRLNARYTSHNSINNIKLYLLLRIKTFLIFHVWSRIRSRRGMFNLSFSSVVQLQHTHNNKDKTLYSSNYWSENDDNK